MLYGLPLEGDTGLGPKHEVKLLYLHEEHGFGPASRWLRLFKASARGREAERLFVSSWSDGDYCHLGIQSVRAATEFEDAHEETDAVLTLINGVQLRIQIKMNSKHNDYREFLERGIFMVLVRPDDTPQEVRKNTIQSILRYKEVLTPNQNNIIS